ncbi:MAG: entericidin A/B family lipoprotein [Desulfuromonadales bacterium]
MRRLLLLVLTVNLLFFLAGCETVRGLGKDMEKAGNWVEKQTQ